MSKAKANSNKKSGVGQGTGKKGWNRWKSSGKKKGPKPYVSKGTKKQEEPKENQDN
ncbi:DUF3934 family protein [Fictibacillus nanhaiensis]|uniref:DUF3934 family protein n=1 Tax=Fictibacillus nanhaiensis TaxID=742169 RepID=UPI001C94ECAF|nr:DUF3934 family protein [Fictibacillus nanhaiensis]MBY6036598.1 DUF3934 family protein [Fictibacillus nanhaiensis]